MKTKGLYYFAHPWTCKDYRGNVITEGETANFNLCAMRAAELILRGYNVFAPIIHTHPIYMSSPEFLSNVEHNLWYDLDNELMSRVAWDGIILAPKWKLSGGCRAEREWFAEREMTLYEYDTLIKQKVIYP